MKFGGTSVGTPARLRAVAARLATAREDGLRVVGVLSAMGHTTDELLDLAHAVSERPHPRELDMLVSVGERVSCALAAMALIDLGHDAVSLTGSQAGIVTDTVHGKAKIVEVRARRIHEALDAGQVVLVAGFQGVSTDSEVTTLGRGGSDTTAVALAAALGADRCDIFTDVDGVFTADPRLVPQARKLDAVTYEEMLELAASGAGVLQLRAVEFARNHGVTLHVRSTFTGADGTLIVEEDERMLEKAMISGVAHTLDETVYRVEGVPAAALFATLADAQVNVDTIVQTGPEIVFAAPHDDRHAAAEALERLGARWSAVDDLGKVSIVGAGMKSHPGIAAKVFRTLDAHGIEPKVVSTSPIKISCHVERDEVERAVRALHDAFALELAPVVQHG
ncbi:MAG: aspartate kinase [Gaiellaceae bacterium]